MWEVMFHIFTDQRKRSKKQDTRRIFFDRIASTISTYWNMMICFGCLRRSTKIFAMKRFDKTFRCLFTPEFHIENL